jgi:hypothetical protein
METATTIDPTRRIAFVDRKEAALIVEVLAAIDTRIDDYVQSGALTGRDADIIGALLERLQEDPAVDPLTGAPAQLTRSMRANANCSRASSTRSAGTNCSDGAACERSAGPKSS